MNSTNNCDINQQSNSNNYTNTAHHDINIKQDVNIIKNDFHIKNNKDKLYFECNSVDQNVKENEKIDNESTVYENDSSPLFTHKQSLTKNTITGLQEFDKICDNYHNKLFHTDDLNIKVPLFSLNQLDLVINDFENFDNIYVPEERNFPYENKVTKIDNLNLDNDSYFNNINAINNVEISIENVAIKGEKVPDILHMDNIRLHIKPNNKRDICIDYDNIKVDLLNTSHLNIKENVSTTENISSPKEIYNLIISNRLHSNPNTNRKISIDTNNTKSELKTEQPITAYINNINLSTTENIILPKDKTINKLRNVRKQKIYLTPTNINDNDLKIINGKITVMDTNSEIPNDYTKNNIFKGNIHVNSNKNNVNVPKSDISVVTNTKFESSSRNVCGLKNKESNNENNIPNVVILDSDDEDSKNSVRNDNFDTISISSDEELKETDNCDSLDIDSDCNGYNSSDFEFIDEDEAKKDILNYNHYNKVLTHNDEFKRIENLQDFIINDYFDTLNPYNLDKNSNKEHTVPQGADFINLFNENFSLRTHCLEIKDVNASIFMNIGYDAVGFDMRMYREDPEMETFRQEANDSKMKILSLYQDENRKRRRRY